MREWTTCIPAASQVSWMMRMMMTVLMNMMMMVITNPKKLHKHNERMDNLYSRRFTGELDDENDDDCVDDDGEDEELPRNFLLSMRQ